MTWETENIKAIGDRINVPFYPQFCHQTGDRIGTELGTESGQMNFFDCLGTHLFQ